MSIDLRSAFRETMRTGLRDGVLIYFREMTSLELAKDVQRRRPEWRETPLRVLEGLALEWLHDQEKSG